MKNILKWEPKEKEPPELVFNPYFYKDYASNEYAVNESQV